MPVVTTKTLDFKTNYGRISVSAAPLSHDDLEKLGLVDKSTNELMASASGMTCTFASKKFVLAALKNHNQDKNAHLEIISELIKKVDELSRKVEVLENRANAD